MKGEAQCKRLKLRGVGCSGTGMLVLRDKLVHRAPGGLTKTVILDLALRGARTRAAARLARTAFEAGKSSLVVGGHGGVPMGMCVLHDRQRGIVDPCAVALGVVAWVGCLLEEQGHTGSSLERVAEVASQQFGFPFDSADHMLEMMGGSYTRDQWMSVSPFVRKSEAAVETALSRAESVYCFDGPPNSGKLAAAMKRFEKRRKKVTIIDSSRVDVPSLSKLVIFRGSQSMDTQRLADLLQRAPQTGLEVVFLGDSHGSTTCNRPGRPFLAMVQEGSPFTVMRMSGERCYKDICKGEWPSGIVVISTHKDLQSLALRHTQKGGMAVFDQMVETGAESELCSLTNPPLAHYSHEWQFRKKGNEEKFALIRVNPLWTREKLREACGNACSGFALYASESVLRCVLARSERRVFHQNLFGSVNK